MLKIVDSGLELRQYVDGVWDSPRLARYQADYVEWRKIVVEAHEDRDRFGRAGRFFTLPLLKYSQEIRRRVLRQASCRGVVTS